MKNTKAKNRKGWAAVSSSELVQHPGLYRAKINCKIGRDGLEGKTQLPQGCSPTEYALFCLLQSVEEIADAMMPNDQAHRPGRE
jgi:hypothetical protein